MEMYLKFFGTLAFGIVGVVLVLKTLLDRVFHDWDLFGDIGRFLRAFLEGKALGTARERPEDVQLEMEKTRQPRYSSRLIDQKREQLKELGLVEHRLSLPNRAQPVVLTPLPPPPVPEEVASKD